MEAPRLLIAKVKGFPWWIARVRLASPQSARPASVRMFAYGIALPTATREVNAPHALTGTGALCSQETDISVYTHTHTCVCVCIIYVCVYMYMI